MNRKQIVLGIVLADFAALTAYAVWQYGYRRRLPARALELGDEPRCSSISRSRSASS